MMQSISMNKNNDYISLYLVTMNVPFFHDCGCFL